jgi:site-specific DNA recombinase
MNDRLHAFAKGKTSNLYQSNTAVAYTRVSTKEQADNNQSLTTQSNQIQQYAQRQGIKIIEQFGGTFESARTDERAEFKQMMAYVKKHNIGLILVYSFDRFSRSGANAVYITDQLKSNNVQVVSVTQPVDATTSSGELQQNIQFIFAQYDNQQRREKCMAGIRQMLSNGDWPTRPPLGYDTLKINGKRTIVINEKGKLLGRGLKKKLKTDLTFKELSEWLKAKGLYVSNKQLSIIARNVFYCGHMSHTALNGEVVVGNHQGIITKKEFLALNDLLKARFTDRKKVNKSNIPEVPLKGHLKCAKCSSNLTAYLVKAKNLWYYKCNTHGCKQNISATKIHQHWESTLTGLQLDPKFIVPITHNFLQTLDKEKDNYEKDRQAITKQVQEYKAQIKTVETNHALGKITEEIYTRVLADIQEKLFPLRAELAKGVFQLSNHEKMVVSAVTNLSNLLTMWYKQDLMGRKLLVKTLYPKGIVVDREKTLYRTQNQNVFIEYIQDITGDHGQTKKRNSELKFNYSALVARSRIELPTSGL